MRAKKSQLNQLDMFVGLFIFMIAMGIFFKYYVNLAPSDDILNDLYTEGQRVSTVLLTDGFPSNWTADDVVSIGITDGNYRIDPIKAARFYNMSYSDVRSKFATKYDFYLYFTDTNASLKVIGGSCGFGGSVVDCDVGRIAYYYSSVSSSYMKDELESLGADVFFKDSSSDDLDELLDNLSNYELVFMENPNLVQGSIKSNSEIQQIIEDYVSTGGTLFLSGVIGFNMLDAKFNSGGGVGDAEIMQGDEYLNFNVGAEITMNMHATIEDDGAAGFKVIGQYQNNKNAIVRLDYGGGFAYFLGDIDTDFEGRTIEPEVRDAISDYLFSGLGENNIDLDAENIVNVVRLAIFESEIVRMNMLVWK